jgi:hypothetical protein
VSTVLATQMVVFHQPKKGSTALEWEDGAGFDPGDARSGRNPRCMVADGATGAYDSIRWVGQLVESFLGLEPEGRPGLDGPAMEAWFRHMQQQWLDRAPATFANMFEERKFQQEGSFATLLGCELSLDSDQTTWRAVALGDAVLFHIREGRLVEEFPPMAPGDFGIDPDGVFTQPALLARMRAGLRFGAGQLASGDQLLLCTDALAAWAVQAGTTGSQPWTTLSAIDHPLALGALVEEQLATRRLKNDDVTLLRVAVSESPANLLEVCQL